MVLSGALIVGAGLALSSPRPTNAAAATGCEGGGFTVSGTAFSVSGAGDHTVPFSQLGPSFQVKGKYVEFTVVSPGFGIEDWLFTGAPNPLDLTGGRRTLVWQDKTPDHRGLILTGDALVSIAGEGVTLQRSGPGLAMKLQAQDCASGGIFQMEVERGDGTTTRVTHVLADGVFYFDNPNFRAREGDVVPFKTTTVTVAARINVANDLSARFVGRDSPQVATRVPDPSCSNMIRKRDGTVATVQHCGRVSRWDVASGGRMGWVTGEDATEVAPPSATCTHQCQAQDRVRGAALVLGFPFPVPVTCQLEPAFPTPFP